VRYDEDARVSRVEQETSSALLTDDTATSDEYAAAGAAD